MLLRAEAISKSFGPVTVLKSADITIEKKARIGLVGGNGAGKTTLLKLLMGLINADSGEVRLNTDKIGYLPQFPDIDKEKKVPEIIGTPYGDVSSLEKKVSRLEAKMSNAEINENINWNEVATKYSLLKEELGKLNRASGKSRLNNIAEKVGLERSCLGKTLSEISGGELTKVMLTRVLMQAQGAEILFLDEPTSHLDVETTEWLEDYLLDLDCAVVVVAHDRYFLDKVVTRVMEIENGGLTKFQGNYTDFIGKKKLETERKRKKARKNLAERRRQKRIAEKQYKENPYLGRHKTRQKMLERMETIKAPERKGKVSMEIEVKKKSGKDVIRANNLEVSRGCDAVVENLELYLEVGDKLGIFGPNGSGKTTLLKSLLKKFPYEGDLWVSPAASIGYFGQGHELVDNKLTAEEQILIAVGKDERLKARNLLARFLIKGEDAERPISTLSGGEKARVALALLIAEKRNLLILDEPTNYLDIKSQNAVESALKEYSGTLIIVTHDRYLLDSVCTKVGELKNRKLNIYKGNFSSMRGQKKKREVVREANVYRVAKAFKDWAYMRKYKPGERIAIAEKEIPRFQWAIDSGKLKRMPGKKKLKKVAK